MRTPRNPRQLGLDHRDRRRLAAALRRSTDVRTYRRIQAVLLVARGLPIPEVAGGTAASPGAVYAWVRRYLRTRRPGDLSDAPRPGRPPAARVVTGQRIAREFRRDPLRVGYTATCWTVALLAEHLGRRYGCRITARTLRRRMRGLGLRWKRPRYVYTGRDPNRGQKKGASSGGSG